MNSTHLPPLPKEGESGPQVCAIVRLYLAVLDDLTPEQVNVLFKHVEKCSACGEEFQLVIDDHETRRKPCSFCAISRALMPPLWLSTIPEMR